jgi:hypothetical protein
MAQQLREAARAGMEEGGEGEREGRRGGDGDLPKERLAIRGLLAQAELSALPPALAPSFILPSPCPSPASRGGSVEGEEEGEGGREGVTEGG